MSVNICWPRKERQTSLEVTGEESVMVFSEENDWIYAIRPSAAPSLVYAPPVERVWPFCDFRVGCVDNGQRRSLQRQYLALTVPLPQLQSSISV